MSDSTEYYKRAFDIIQRGGKLRALPDAIRKHKEVFNKVHECLGKNITSKIEKCNSQDKGILFVGNNGNFIIGAVAFAWACHIQKYRLAIPDTTYLRISDAQHGWFWCQDYFGLDEEIIKKDLDSQIGILDNRSNNIVLFFRSINIKHTDSLNRIARAVRSPRLIFPFLTGQRNQNCTEFQGRVTYTVTGGVKMPQLIILSMNNTVGVSKEFLQNFEIIRLGGVGEKQKGRTIPKSKEYLRRDDIDGTFYAKAKGRDTEARLKLSGQPYKILYCLFNMSSSESKITSVPIDKVLYEAGIKRHTKGANISKDKRDHLHTKINFIKNEFEVAYNDRDRIKVIEGHCELHVKCIDDFDDT